VPADKQPATGKTIGALTMTARDRKIFDLWLACHTTEEIAAAVNMTHQSISIILR
jgi:DNA-binding CsgD family transcriptional regulator